MKIASQLILLVVLFCSCQSKPAQWSGPEMSQVRDHLTVDELVEGKQQPLIDMSYFTRPDWAKEARDTFSGTIIIQDSELTFPKGKEHYDGETIFPNLELDFISHNGALIPLVKERISTRRTSSSLWDVMLGAGKVWHEENDGEWSRASFPINLTDRWIGTVRNCVATFVYKPDVISNICLQCSQESADIDDQGIGNISGILGAIFDTKPFENSDQIVNQHLVFESNRIQVKPLSEIDSKNKVANYFDKPNYTNAPTSMGAILMDGTLYMHPPKTRHGLYPYPNEMRHGLYSVTKTMAGALALTYLEERYDEDVFNASITDYVPALADHPGWKGVTFSNVLNMSTGVDGGEDAERLLNKLILAETAEEAINNIATLVDLPELPGQKFHYATTNSFVLSYAMQKYVEEREGKDINYWDLVHKDVLIPIGAEHFKVLRTIEENEKDAIPILGYGALPTVDEAAKIASLFANKGSHGGKQILNREKLEEVFGDRNWNEHGTNEDFRGSNYLYSFWSKQVKSKGCKIMVNFMLGFGEHYVVFLPSGAILIRFYDEHDLNIDKLVRAVEEIRSSCDAD